MAKRAATVKVDSDKLVVGADISIFVSGGTCATMVAVLMIHGTIVAATEKAVQIRVENARAWTKGKDVTLWIPKSAIVEPPPDPPHVAAYWASVGGRATSRAWHLAAWFRFDAYGQRVLDRIDAGITAINWPSRAA